MKNAQAQIDMTKIHVLTNKSEIKKEKLEEKLVIVLDILIATSSIVTALANGCKFIVPVRNYDEAIHFQSKNNKLVYKYSGELNADTLPGFIQPTPLALLNSGMKDAHLVYCTTNGTVALNDCKNAKKTYVGSLLNANAIVQNINSYYQNENIIIVCSGSNDQFNIEDFYGAGYFVEKLLISFPEAELSDSAKAAQIFHSSGSSIELLNQSRVGKLLNDRNWHDEVLFASQKDLYDVVPYLTSLGTIELMR